MFNLFNSFSKKKKCYRKNADHLRQYWHPPKEEPPFKKQKTNSDHGSGEESSEGPVVTTADDQLVKELIQIFGPDKREEIVTALIKTNNDSTKAAQILTD